MANVAIGTTLVMRKAGNGYVAEIFHTKIGIVTIRRNTTKNTSVVTVLPVPVRMHSVVIIGTLENLVVLIQITLIAIIIIIKCVLIVRGVLMDIVAKDVIGVHLVAMIIVFIMIKIIITVLKDAIPFAFAKIIRKSSYK